MEYVKIIGLFLSLVLGVAALYRRKQQAQAENTIERVIATHDKKGANEYLDTKLDNLKKLEGHASANLANDLRSHMSNLQSGIEARRNNPDKEGDSSKS